MTTEPVTPAPAGIGSPGLASLGADSAAGADALTCYRHADRETYVRCGRCERPICPRCAVQGPVGLRCRDCGRPGRDPLTHLSPPQLATGLAVALAAGTAGGFVGLHAGVFFALCGGPFIGALIGEGVMRATGYKRGQMVRALVVGGIIGGLVIAALLESTYLWSVFQFDAGYGMDALMTLIGFAALGSFLYLIAALVGAFARLR